MKPYTTVLFLLFVAATIVGCGSSGPETDDGANAEMKKLESSPDYEKEMMGGGDK
ncbi:MAG: hypothetical protein HQ518_15545 [Rhodopirellula sp.]|nr:hypothetical protein [Rhodopirellula sp.]